MSAIAPSVSVALPLVSVVGEVDATIRNFRRRATAERDAVVNRILDWCDQAHTNRRDERAQYLLNLAWEAFDRLRI